MRNLKKFLALVLAMMMTLGLMVTVNAAFVEDYEDRDEVKAAYGDAVDFMNGLGVFQGNGDNNFRPKDTITRAEVTAVVYRVLTGDVNDKQKDIYANYPSQFTDVPNGVWYEGYVNYCANGLYVRGYGDGRFGPHDNVNGYQLLAIMLRAIGYGEKGEFEGTGWETRTATTAQRLGITKNVSEVLSAPATREMVAEILYQAIQTDTVTYTYTYEKNVLVPDTDTNRTQYAAYLTDGGDLPICENLLYRSFQIVGANITAPVSDEYGRPGIAWCKDDPSDTINAGTKYVANNGDEIAFTLRLRPIKVYEGDVITECQLTTDINNHKSISGANVTEYLNGRLVSPRLETDTDGDGVCDLADGDAWYVLEATHTTDTASAYTLNAPGRTMEVYRTGTTRTGASIFTFVYYDTLMGVITEIIPRTYDTANHVMDDAELHIRVNDGPNTTNPNTGATSVGPVVVVAYSDVNDFEYWSVGQPILFTTWGGRSYNDRRTEDLVDNVPASLYLPYQKIQKVVPQRTVDFLAIDDNPYTWAIDIIDEKPETATFTVNATTGARDFKTGLIDTNGKEYPGNVVYLANKAAAAAEYYVSVVNMDDETVTKIDGVHTTVPMSPTNYGEVMKNEAIGKTYTAVLDKNGYVVGLTKEATTTDVGVITAIDTVRIGTGKYVVEADLLMMDGTTKTIRMLDNQDESYDANTKYDYFDATTVIAAIDASNNCNADVGVLVQIEPYSKDGATYYKVIATHSGKNTAFDEDEVGESYGDGSKLLTGVAYTLTGDATTDDTDHYNDKYPVADSVAKNVNYINDNTRFIIAEQDYRYDLGNGTNEGGKTELTYANYTGFKNIPTITATAKGGSYTDENGDAQITSNAELLYQKVGNNVYVYPQLDSAKVPVEARTYTIKPQTTYDVDETYLVLGTVATYADHATYKVLKDGVETTLDVSNTNGDLNAKIEAAMDANQLISVASRNGKGYATAVNVYSLEKDDTGTGDERTRTIAYDTNVLFAKDGVLHLDVEAAHPTDSGDSAGVLYLTIADGCNVVIVNKTNKSSSAGTLNSIMQYERYSDSATFVYELDKYGYISTLYIID